MDEESKKLAAQRKLVGFSTRDLEEQPERFERKEIKRGEKTLDDIANDPLLTNKLRADLAAARAGLFSEEELKAFKEEWEKEKARRAKAAWVTRRKKILETLEKEIRSDRTISKLQKMLQIREIQKQRANL